MNLRSKSAIPVTIAILVLATAGAALAAFTQVSQVTLTAHKAGQSTGITSSIHSSDPTAPGAKPKSATRLLLTFPTGTTFNLATSLIKPCTYTDRQLATAFGPSCAANSKIGSGSAIANAAPLASKVNASVAAFVRSAGEMVLVVKPALPGAPTIVIDATVSGSKLTIPIPNIKLAGISVVLVALKLNVPALGSGRQALITAGRCSSHAFVVTSHFVYTDGSTLMLSSSSACS